MDTEDIARLVNNLKLSTDAKETAVVLTKEEGERGRKRSEKVVVGKIFSRKPVNQEILKANLPKILRSRGRTEIEMVGHNLFVITFSLETDKRIALEEGPWHFFQDLMILKQTEAMQTPSEVDFNSFTIWVQCHNVPIAWIEPKIIQRIGERVGKVEEVDFGEGGLCVGKYARVRVTRRIDQPLVRCVPVMDDGNDKEVLVVLQYEKLPKFYFACGRVGHISRDCEDDSVNKTNFQFDSWLRAGRPMGGTRTSGLRTADTSLQEYTANSSLGQDQVRGKGNEKGVLVVRPVEGNDREKEGLVVSEMEGVERENELLH